MGSGMLRQGRVSRSRVEGNGTGAVDGLWKNYEMESYLSETGQIKVLETSDLYRSIISMSREASAAF